MKRKYKRRTSRFGIFFVFLTAVTIAGVFFIPWAMKPDNFRNEKNKINSWLNGIFFQDFYNAKSLILVDLSNDNIFISKRENEQQLPASLAKLFVIEYAATLADLDSIVPANYEAIQLTKPGSSVANIDAKKYFLHNLFAAMLVPSGNDAAYVVADYCGSILSPQAKNSQERINVFMEHLNNYLQNQGYENTILYDPSGYDVNALTTVSDLKSVSTHLLEKQWFRDIVSKSNYTATLPDGSTQTWRNTNTFLDQTSEYYNENVKGIKTGSLSNDYNLVVLYKASLIQGVTPVQIRERMEKLNPDRFRVRKFGVSDVIVTSIGGKTQSYYVNPKELIKFNGFFTKLPNGEYLLLNEEGYQVEGQKGTWTVTDEKTIDEQRFVLMVNDQKPDLLPSIVVQSDGKFITSTASGFDNATVRKVRELLHHEKFLENGTAERARESGTEQNYNMIDGCVNNVPKKPRVIGGRVSVLDRLHIKQAERARKDNAQVQQQERTRKN